MPDLSKRRWWLLLVVMAGGLAGGAHLLSVALRGDAQSGVTAAAGEMPLRTVVAYGTVDVEKGICKMYLTVPGAVVSEVLVKPGESVRAGAVLVRLDDTLARKKVDEAEAALEVAKAARDRGRSLPEQHRLGLQQAEAAIKAAEAQRNVAQAEVDRTRRLIEASQLNKDALRTAEEQLRAADEGLRSKQLEFARLKTQDPHAELNGLQAQVRQADAALAQAREALKQYALVAPAAGIVLQITVREGDTVGGPSPVPAIQFCPAGPRVVKADVDQASASLVAVGQRVTIEDDAHGPGRWTGKVTWIADWFTNPRPVLVPDPGQYSDVRGMPCIIELDANQRSLKLNQRVLATIDVSPKSR